MTDQKSSERIDVRLGCIESYLAVLHLGSFAAAGRSLNVNESTIRNDIDALEAWLCKELFVRKPKVRPSPYGESFEERATEIVRTMHGFRRELTLDQQREVMRVVEGYTAQAMRAYRQDANEDR